MKYLLDTCVLSEYVKKSPSSQVLDWLDEQQERDLFISIISIGELKKGLFKIKLSQPQKFQRLWQWLEKLEIRFQGRIIPINESVINQWSKLCGESEAKGKKLAVLDSLITATALVNNLVVITRNVDDFAMTSVKIFNPWELGKK